WKCVRAVMYAFPLLSTASPEPGTIAPVASLAPPEYDEETKLVAPATVVFTLPMKSCESVADSDVRCRAVIVVGRSVEVVIPEKKAFPLPSIANPDGVSEPDPAM